MFSFIDVETIPAQDREPFLRAAAEKFSAPSTLTKEKAADELGLLETKNLSKDKVIELWTERFRDSKSLQAGDTAWRNTALDATYGRLVSIAFKIDENETRGICNPVDERKLLIEAFVEIEKLLEDRKPYWIGHNVTFDLKFLFRRAVILEVMPPFELPFKGRHGHDYFCTMQAWCDYREMISQAKLLEALNIEPDFDPIDGSQVCDAWLQGRTTDILNHNMSDVNNCAKAFRRLQFFTES